jgi:small subunit ribosomal protein S4e
MARGPKHHLKRLNAPKSWLLSKLGGIWAPRPSTGPHKLRECLPISLALRNRLKYALTRREVIMIVMRRSVEVDGKIRTDINYPAGFQDVLRIAKTDEQFRLLYDVKGRYVLHRISSEESQYKLCRVVQRGRGGKGSIGRNPFQTGQAQSIPYIVTHDGRTIRYPDPLVSVHDTVKFDLKTSKITGHLKFDVGNLAMVTRGANIGRAGVIISKEKHPGSFDIVHLRDKKGNDFATRIANVFVIGEGAKPWISIPKQKGQKLTILEERQERSAAIVDKAVKKAKSDIKSTQ